ncbi:alpha/beta hydrolase [Sporolactobacillus sp. THM7-4]|nr:alpha/beta hydrolase [Sporolactobacillus sp. THM7-4]
MAFLKTNDFSIHFSVHLPHRNNPTVLLIHELTLGAAEWEPMIRHFGDTINFITYDSFGYKKILADSHPLSFEYFILKAHALLEHLKIKSVHVVGDGIGGNIAFELARRYPMHVASLTLMSTPLSFQDDVVTKPLTTLAQLITIDRRLVFQKLLMDNFHTHTEEKARILEKTFTQVSAQTVKKCIFALQHFYDPVHFHFVDELSRLNIPTLVLHGTEDPVFPVQLAAVYALCIPGSRLMTIPGAAHCLPLDQPELAARYLIRFILGEKTPPLILSVHKKQADDFRRFMRTGLEPSRAHRYLLRMNVMGKFSVLWNGEPIQGKWSQRGAKELLLFLILHQGSASRTKLIQTFLPDLPSERARNHLRVRLNHLNQIFRASHNPEVKDILIIDKDTVALNAEIESDVGNYMAHLSKIAGSDCSLNDQVVDFIDLLKQYDPARFSSFKEDWVFMLTNQIESRLSTLMEQLLPKMREKKMFPKIREMLQNSRFIEPYDGYCDKHLAELEDELPVR